MPLLRDGFIDPAALPGCPAAQAYRATLAGFLATRAASQPCEMAEHTLLIHGDCPGAIAALRKAYLHVPGETMKAEGVDDLSRGTAQARRDSESTAAPRCIATREAERLGATLSVDLFATATTP